jgi:hypothetical protein
VTDDLRRSRVTVFFRPLFLYPHLIWSVVWSYAAFVAAVANWIFTLILGRSPQALEDFLFHYIRYGSQVLAYGLMTANPFPGFLGVREYPVDVTLESGRQRRLITLFRPILAIPALLLSWVLLVVYLVLGIAAWFVCLVLGRMPKGMRDLGAYCLRYETQTRAYLTFLTDRYPSLSASNF